jgi:two-component system chemotaxis sensor kinase CheA
VQIIFKLFDDLAAGVVLEDRSPAALADLAGIAARIAEVLQSEPASAALAAEAAATAETLKEGALGIVEGDPLAAAERLVFRWQDQGAAPAQQSGPVQRSADMVELCGEFLQEAEEGLAKAEELLLKGEKSGFEEEAINDLFRVFHSIKGLAGHLPDTRQVVELTHQIESLLDLARGHSLSLEGAALEVLFEATDLLLRALEALREACAQGTAVAQLAGLPAVIRRLEAAQSASHEAQPAAEAATGSAAGKANLGETLRVDLARLDALLEQVGELTIVQQMVVHAPELKGRVSSVLEGQLALLSRISRELQDSAMRLRMVPVRSVFRRMHRLVRELANREGKQVEFVASGEATEMDRSIIHSLEEPLVHLIRNALDHGIEPAAERLAAGKGAVARLKLSASHEGGLLVVEVADDGRGLNREAILSRAHERGLVEQGAALADEDVWSLIFEPGFSTAERITELSGRGVGLDVVKRNVESIRGTVQVRTRPGEGTSFRLVLPLTMAVIDGMLVGVGAERYVIPSLAVVESLAVDPATINAPAGGGELLEAHGRMLALVRLGELFAVPAADAGRKPIAVIVESMGQRVALLVDQVFSQQQVVIKPLGDGVGAAEHFGGAAILADGKVGLILNVDRICSRLARRTAGTAESWALGAYQ